MKATQFRNHTLRRLGHLFNGADAGYFTLPATVTAGIAAIENLEAERQRLATLPAGMTGFELIEEIKTAARAGTKFPTGAALAEAERDRLARDTYATALNNAAGQLEDILEGAVVAAAETIITGHLRPALNEVVADTTRIATELRPYGIEPHGLLAAPDKARKARQDLDRVTVHYRALRDAQGAASSLRGEAMDNGRLFEIRNYTDLTAGYRAGAKPWPTDDTAAKLLWFIDHGADIWMPTVAERDDVITAEIDTQKVSA